MMKAIALSLAAFFIFAPKAHAAPLHAYRWKARPFLVFGAKDSGLFQEQLAILDRASAGLRERDVIVISVTAEEAREDFHRVYAVPPGEFQVLLVGKDGGIKLRSRELVRPQRIFGLVDAMPMRREEMNGR